MNYSLSRLAEADIDGIIDYTNSVFGEHQTREYVSGLLRAFELLGDNMYMGRKWQKDVRRFVYRAHYIFYRIDEDGPFITRVWNTSFPPMNYLDADIS